MIQFRRGTTKNWRSAKTKLASGQPGYDKEKHKIKVGDGEKSWNELPYASGLFEHEVFDSEVNAKSRVEADVEDRTIITYGTEAPDENTVGRLYLQQSTSDYVIDSGVSDGWIFQVYSSGIVKCFGSFNITSDIVDSIEGTGLYCGSIGFQKAYPIAFKTPPTELVSLQGNGGISWLVGKAVNTSEASGIYDIISTASKNGAEYIISVQVIGVKA